MDYIPATNRYEKDMSYTRCGNTGLFLPSLSLGLWHNFGDADNMDEAKKMILYAFDHGIIHFDLANNYGPPPGSAEQNFGRILKKHLNAYRDELFISSKAGYLMWPGPYGTGGSRKYLMASIDQSLQRTGLAYFDIFYSHRYDPNTPLEETLRTLVDIVKQGKALYIGLSNYPAQIASQAFQYLKEQGTPCLLHQCRYNLFVRDIEKEILPTGEQYGVGLIAFSPLAQGLLTDKYLHGIPAGSRADRQTGYLKREQVTPDAVSKAQALHNLAQQRGQTLAAMALAWILRDKRITSVLVGASSVAQLQDNLEALRHLSFSDDELSIINQILQK